MKTTTHYLCYPINVIATFDHYGWPEYIAYTPFSCDIGFISAYGMSAIEAAKKCEKNIQKILDSKKAV
jgi:hypothetical protein